MQTSASNLHQLLPVSELSGCIFFFFLTIRKNKEFSFIWGFPPGGWRLRYERVGDARRFAYRRGINLTWSVHDKTPLYSAVQVSNEKARTFHSG